MPGLLAPFFLAGLAALAVPVLVHLVNKQQKEPIRFPSLMFLENISYRDVDRQRLQHLLLFLLRCLILLLLIFAFARPFFAKDDAHLATDGGKAGKDVVILLDRSYSMEYGDRWERAVAAAKDVVGRMGSSDRGTIVYFAGTATLASNLTDDKRALLAAIDSVKPTAGVTRYGAAFQLARRVFSDTAQPRREVVLISDYQRSGVGGDNLPSLPNGAILTQVYLGDSTTTNVVVAHGELRQDTMNGREGAVVAVRLANRGNVPVNGREVTLEVNGRQVQSRTVNISANGAAQVEFASFFVPPGVSRGVVRTGTDALTRDNVFHFVVSPRKPMSVLVVQPRNAESQAGLFVANALNVGTPPLFTVNVVKADNLSAASLLDVSLVILNGAPIPSGEMGQQLSAYVKNGGGLLVALGTHSNPASWPSLADALLPRPVEGPIDRLDDNGITLGYVDRGHAIFDVFNTSRSGDFSTARVLHYWNITAGPEDRELARFGDGRVALLERRVGLGRVLVWASDLDGLWNNLPMQPVFLPFLHQTVHYASGTSQDNPWMTVGNVVDPNILFGDRTDVASSASQSVSIRSTQYAALTPTGTQLRFGLTESPELTEQGVYEVTRSGSAGQATRVIAVNIDPAESDLAPLDTALVRVSVAPLDTLGAQTSVTEPLAPEDRERRQRIWWYLLLAMLALLGAETLVSNRLSRSVLG